MKKLQALFIAVFFLIAGSSFAQTAQPAAAAPKAKKEVKAATAQATTDVKTKKDGTLDKRYAENKKLKKDGTPDKRYSENKNLKKDGTPDKRFKSKAKADSLKAAKTKG